MILKEESLYEKAKKELSLDIFTKLENINPNIKNKGITEWIIRNYLKNKSIINEADKITSGLKIFNKLKITNKITEKDINKYSIDKIIELSNQVIISKKDEKKEYLSGAEKLYENDEWLLLIPKTYKSACNYGSGTKWCTASTKDNLKYKEYMSKGFLIFLINKKNAKEKYSMNKEMNSFVSASDKELSTDKIKELLDKLPSKIVYIIEKDGVNYDYREIKEYINEKPFTVEIKEKINNLSEFNKNKLLKIIISYPTNTKLLQQFLIILKKTKTISPTVKIMADMAYSPIYKKAIRKKLSE